MIKKLLKTVAYRTASLVGRHNRPAPGSDLLVLTYHRILPVNDIRAVNEQPGMMVTPETFELHMEILAEKFEFVSLSEWVENDKNGRALPTRACAITFDDGWKDNYEFAFPVLRTRNIPATFFLVSNMIGTARDFWPGDISRVLQSIMMHGNDRLDDPLLERVRTAIPGKLKTGKILSSEELDRVIENFKQSPDSENEQYLEELRKNFAIEPDEDTRVILNHREIQEMLESQLVEIGSHSYSHQRLREGISKEEMQHQIIDSRKQLEGELGVPVKLFCYPNGETTPQSISMVSDNYIGACSTLKGWNSSGVDPYLLKRINIHEDITNTRVLFLARISGLL